MSSRTIGAKVARISFLKLWRLRGSPTMRVIKPISTWTLASGVTYDANRDQFVNGSGVPQVVSYLTQPHTIVGFLVNQSRKDVELAIPGVLTTDSIDVTILWTQEMQEQIAACWGIVISSKLYRVSTWEVLPMGTPTPTEIKITLIEGS